jgi:hypothetical protein
MIAPTKTGSKIVPDELGREAVKQGFRRGDISAAKQANPPTKKELEKMLSMKRQILADSSKSDKFRPLDVAGNHVKKRLDFVVNRANSLRNVLNKTSKSLKGENLNTFPIQDRMMAEFDRLNIFIPEEVKRNTTLLPDFLKGKDVFRGSDISQDRSAQKLIRSTMDILKDASSDAFRAHRVKRELDTMIDYRRGSSLGLTPEGQRFAKSIRGSINDQLRELSPEYARVNDDLSRALTAIESIVDVTPSKVNPFIDSGNKALGQELRKLESNYGSRQALEEAMRDLDNTVKQLGGTFDVDIRELVRFNNTLDDRFGATARGSFQGQQEQAFKQAVRGPQGARDFAIDLAAPGS